MNCDKVKNLLSAFLDAELPSGDISLIKFHLQNCEECQIEYQEISESKNLLSSLSKKTLPENYFFNLKNKLAKTSNQNSLKNIFKNYIDKIRLLNFPRQTYKLKFFLLTTLALSIIIIFFALNNKNNYALNPRYYLNEHHNALLNHPLNKGGGILDCENINSQYVLYIEEE